MASFSGSVKFKIQSPIRGDARQIVQNVHKFLSEQKAEFNLKYNAIEEAAEAIGVSRSMVERICRGSKGHRVVAGASTPKRRTNDFEKKLLHVIQPLFFQPSYREVRHCCFRRPVPSSHKIIQTLSQPCEEIVTIKPISKGKRRIMRLIVRA